MKPLWKHLIIFFILFDACSASKMDSKGTSTNNPSNVVTSVPTIVITDSAITQHFPNIGDGGFLSSDPCGPPCFFGIFPGRTTIAEAMDILKKKSMDEACKEFNYVDRGGIRGLDCESFILNFEDDFDIIDSIGFKPSIMIRVRDVIQKYGSPNFVSIFPRGLPEYPPRVSMVIFYDEDEFCGDLILPEQDGLTYKLEENTLITDIGYFVKSECEQFYSTRSQKWNGYGGYDAGPL